MRRPWSPRSAASRRTSTADATEYLTATAAIGDVTSEVAATGAVEARETWALGFGGEPVLVADGTTTTAGSGTWTVATVEVAPGSVVKAGDVLATASTDDLEDQLTIAKTSLASARVQERLAKATLEDADDSGDTAAIRQAKIGNYGAVNGRRQAEQEVADLREQIELATLVAPIDGTVTSVSAVAGRPLTGTALTLASSAYEVTTDVVEGDISEMAVGQPATVTVDAIGATIQGEVTAIAQAASAGSGTSDIVSFPVTVSLTGAPSDLREGMTAEVTIVSASVADVLTVPSAALRGTAGDYRVQVLGADGVPVAQPVTVGLITESTAEIKEGLEAGQVVVTGTSASRTATGATGQGPTTIGGGGVIGVPGTGRPRQLRPAVSTLVGHAATLIRRRPCPPTPRQSSACAA